MAARVSWVVCVHSHRLLFAWLAVCACLAASCAGSAVGTSTPAEEAAATCPTAGMRALDRHETNSKKAVVVTRKCKRVAIGATSGGAAELDASAKNLDIVVGYPDVSSLNLAFNNLESFPSVENETPLLHLNLSQNRLASLGDVHLPSSLKSLDLSFCQLESIENAALPNALESLYLDDQPLGDIDAVAFPPALDTLSLANTNLSTISSSDSSPIPRSLSKLNVSYNAITSITGIRFPWTLRQLDLRGNPLTDLEISRSDLNIFRTWMSFTPALSQRLCKHSAAKKVIVLEVELCVLEDADFNRIYGVQSGSGSLSAEEVGSSSPPPVLTPTAEASTDASTSKQSPLSWFFLIIGMLSVTVIVVGIIAMLSWKHQQLRKKMRVMLQTNGHVSLSDTILVAMGFDDHLLSLRIESDDVRVLHVLGKAGCGMLYLAELTRRRSQFRTSSVASAVNRGSTGSEAQFVMLKKILPELTAVNSASLTIFLQEIRLMSQLEHPKIIAFIGITRTSISDIAMVLEFLPNGDLGTLLRIDKDREQSLQSRRLRWFEPDAAVVSTMSLPMRSIPSKSAIALDILEALVYLHSFTSPVIHRELRAQNVLLNKKYAAKLCNFGAPSEWQVNTSQPECAECIAWVAPEILRGELYSEKADMYSFGVVLAEMASCSRPFAGLLTAEIIFQVLTEDARPEIGSDCPDDIRLFAMKCMHTHPDFRPSALEAHQEMRSFRLGSRLSAL